MNKKLFLMLILIFTIGLANAQSILWTKTTQTRLDALQKFERASIPSKADYYALNLEALKIKLQAAPTRDFSTAISSTIVSFPNADGALEQFSIFESSVMAPQLAAKHLETQSYVGQGVTNPSARIYLTTTVFGLHAMVLSDQGTYYIDPYTTDLKGYIVYNKSNLTSSKSFICYNNEEVEDNGIQVSTNSTNSALITNGRFRTYRLAMACTIEYAAYHINAAINAGIISSFATEEQKKLVVLAAMNVTVSRINSLYEMDMSLRMQLVASNDAIIFITSDDFDNNNANVLINQSQTTIDNTIGFSEYDIGHTVSTGGGGLAQSPSVCTSGKARGITGSPSPVGDPYDIDYVAHEVGHQFGASHTFNNSCGNNRSSAQAVEPGSGSTILAYAGICPANVQNNSDSYFHAVSIAQMAAHILGSGGNCVTGVLSNNAAPVIASLTNGLGGQTNRANMTVFFNASAGPFQVTSQNTSGITWGSAPQTITWNVANTNVAPVNTTNVNILLSTDGGLTYPITLVANTPNDGSEVITVPNAVSSNCRIMIEAVGNIFLAVNSNVFTVNNFLSTTSFELDNLTIAPNPNSGNFNVQFNSLSNEDVLINVYDISGREIFTKSYPNQSVFAQSIQLNNVQAGVYLVNIQDGNQKSVRKIVVQ